MKRECHIILSLFLGILACSCFNETSEREINEYNLNSIGKEFMERVTNDLDWQVEWEKFEEFGRVEPNLAYMALGGGYGRHYILPILSNNELKAIVIYPFDENTNTLKKPSIFNSYLERFMGENSIVHLKFEYSNDLGTTVNGKLEYQMDKYWLTIKLNEVRLMNASPLRLARTLMHEVIHANIFAKLMSLYPKLKPDLNTQEMMDLSEALDKQNFPSLYYYYEKYVFDATAQHQYMAAYNVDVIAAVLQEMDPTASKDLRHAIAWEGLKYIETRINGVRKIVETEAWKALSSMQKQRMAEAFGEYSKVAKNECKD